MSTVAGNLPAEGQTCLYPRMRATLCLAFLLSPIARADEPAIDDALRAQLMLLGDGHGHYVALAERDTKSRLYYGDGKTMTAVPVDPAESTGAGADGDFKRYFLDGRFPARAQIKDWRDIDKSLTAVVRSGGQVVVRCGAHQTPLTLVEAAKAGPMLAAARFVATDHRRAFALARDAKGRYYYIDRGDSETTNKSYRVFVGNKGNLKKLKMVDVVDDSEGQLFVTASGKLRLYVGRTESQWSDPAGTQKLTVIPVEENLPMIFGELGVYLGERLGTPCDDL